MIGTLREGVQIAWDSLRENKIRAGLTILGVAIGVAVVVTMAALITGIRSSVLESFAAAGPDNFIVTPFDFTDVRVVTGSGRPPWWGRPVISDEEIRAIGNLPGVQEAVADFDFNLTVDVGGGVRLTGVSASGNSSGWPAYTLGEFTAGRNFTPAEEGESRPLIILSSGLAEALFGQMDPVGRNVRLSVGTRSVNERFTVVGVYQPEPNVFSNAVDQFAIVPRRSAVRRLKALSPFTFTTVLVVPRASVTQDEARDQVIAYLRGVRGLRPAEENNFAVVQSAQLADFFDRLTGVFFLVMLALSSVGLLVGGVGVIGIMLISVTERTREIGIRKAMGATRREILWQFLVEASFLTLVGGAIGMIMGAVAAFAVANATPIPASIPLWSVAAALGSAVFTGMLFGLLPALRASRMEPVAALRFE